MREMMQSWKTRMGPRRRLLRAVALALTCAMVGRPALAEYLVDAGDVVEISIGGPVDFSYRAAVQLDGTITVPRLGTISVAGLQPSEIKTRIQAELLSKPIRMHGADGRTSSYLIAPDEVAAAVVEYRPVYVNGDIAKPGQYAFRPGMSVRQCIAIAGGFAARALLQDTRLQAADLRIERDAINLQLAELDIRQTRRTTELDGKAEPVFAVPADLRTSQTALLALQAAETQLFHVRRDQFQREMNFLQQSIKETGDMIATLAAQLKREDDSTQTDEKEMDSTLALFRHGDTTSVRVADLRRAILASTSRRAQLSVQLRQAVQQNEGHSKEIEQLESQRKIGIIAELQDDTLKQNELHNRLLGVRDKLQLVSSAPGPAAAGHHAHDGILIIRNGKAGNERLPVDEDVALQPGDVVEISGDGSNLDLALVR